jgi:hypothetical protein
MIGGTFPLVLMSKRYAAVAVADGHWKELCKFLRDSVWDRLCGLGIWDEAFLRLVTQSDANGHESGKN